MHLDHRQSLPQPTSPLDAWLSRVSPSEGRRGMPVSWVRASRAAVVAGLGRPALWPWSVASFLLRGGIVLFILPIVVLPSTVGVATFIGPMAVTAAGPTEGFVALVALAFGLLGVWLVVGGFLAAWAERELVSGTLRGDGGETEFRDAAGREDPRTRPLDRPQSRGIAVLLRILCIRLIALLPIVVILVWAGSRIATVGYEELTAPGEVATALPLRVLSRVADALVVTGLVWLASEVVAGIAVRRVIIRGDSVVGAVVSGAMDALRHPLTTLLTAVVPLAGTLFLVGPSLAGTWIAWNRLKLALGSGSAEGVVVLTILFVTIWSASLVLAAAATSWRSAAWTFELLRREPEDAVLPGWMASPPAEGLVDPAVAIPAE